MPGPSEDKMTRLEDEDGEPLVTDRENAAAATGVAQTSDEGIPDSERTGADHLCEVGNEAGDEDDNDTDDDDGENSEDSGNEIDLASLGPTDEMLRQVQEHGIIVLENIPRMEQRAIEDGNVEALTKWLRWCRTVFDSSFNALNSVNSELARILCAELRYLESKERSSRREKKLLHGAVVEFLQADTRKSALDRGRASSDENYREEVLFFDAKRNFDQRMAAACEKQARNYRDMVEYHEDILEKKRRLLDRAHELHTLAMSLFGGKHQEELGMRYQQFFEKSQGIIDRNTEKIVELRETARNENLEI